jgi:hypothetical protein
MTVDMCGNITNNMGILMDDKNLSFRCSGWLKGILSSCNDQNSHCVKESILTGLIINQQVCSICC